MSWFNQVDNLLKRYSSGGAAAQPAPDVHAHFDQVAQAAPPSAIAEGLAAAFRSDRTPAFGQMLSGLFTQSNGEQKVGLLNQLMAAVDPAVLTRVLSGAGLTGLLSGGTPQANLDQVQKISPDVVQQLAAHAEKTNPSFTDSISTFYAQHTNLIKTLGGTALSIALAKIAERQRQR